MLFLAGGENAVKGTSEKCENSERWGYHNAAWCWHWLCKDILILEDGRGFFCCCMSGDFVQDPGVIMEAL